VILQFPIERKIGSLGRLIRSASRPHARLVANVTRNCKAELVSSFAEKFLPEDWARATRKKQATVGLPVGSFFVPELVGPDSALLPPKCAPAVLGGPEHASMRAALAQENESVAAEDILAKKYYRAKLASRKYAGSKPVGSDCDKHWRRNYLVRINSTEKFYRENGTVEERPVSTFGADLH